VAKSWRRRSPRSRAERYQPVAEKCWASSSDDQHPSEQVPPIDFFSENTAAFIHELPSDSVSNARGESDYVRINVLTPIGVLDRDKKLGVVREMTEIVAAAAGDPTLAERTWVLISEAPDGGWGIDGHPYLNAEIADTARRILAGGRRSAGANRRPGAVDEQTGMSGPVSS
jgi:phenylpyruvate tautomerase PptA (4-oxalocrotonate tautomerase family)